MVVSLSDARGKLPMDKLLEMKLDGVSFDHLASVYEEYTGKIAVENLRPSWLIFSTGFQKSAWLAAAKRALDLCWPPRSASCVAAPIMIAGRCAIRLTSVGPALYHQQRVGRHGASSSRSTSSARCGSTPKRRPAPCGPRVDDPRITPLGRFLRRTRLDELPQLWNVLKGDMSFVGPRPERPEFVQQLTQEIPFYGQRHVVRPGLTGWAQVRYTYGASVEDALMKLQYDLFYIKNLSLALDLLHHLLDRQDGGAARRGA